MKLRKAVFMYVYSTNRSLSLNKENIVETALILSR